MKKIASCRVAIFGLGGVGGYVAEALARSGIGALDLIDHDLISVTNLNRQILATVQTIGRYKADVAEERVRSISPDCTVRAHKLFYLPETQDRLDFRDYDYVVDAIDTVTGKLLIIENAKKAGVPVISSMGTGNKVNPAALEVADLYETSVCPLARIMRRECRKRGIDSLKVVYSREAPMALIQSGSGKDESARSGSGTSESANSGIETSEAGSDKAGRSEFCRGESGLDEPVRSEHVKKEKDTDETAESEFEKTEPGRRAIPGSTAFVPAAAGLLIASEVIRDLMMQSTGD